MAAGDRAHGFVVKAATPVDEVRAVAIELEHLRSGARVLHLHADDDENLFSISFPTPPPDDTGLPHILEHSVLSGSHNYPVRDPFFEMLKMSMATFLNAMTAADCTFYPVASNVKADLFNLASVYFDAVFHPLLTPETFRREGHHLAPADKSDPTGALTVNGIVYSEMKGAFSHPESRLYRCASRGLLPDTIYGWESGGDPEAIPDLTYADFKHFHQTHYHPSNAYIVLYGNIPTTEHLAFLGDKLDAFERIDFSPEITPQPRWERPRSVEDAYPIGSDEPADGKTYIVLNWLVGDATDALDVVCLEILSQVLLGHEAAPLRKAVIDSKLGEDLTCSGFGPIGLETAFRVGLKGAEPERVEAFVDLVMRTLRELAGGEFDPEQVEAAFRQTSFHYLEVLPSFPLHAMSRVLGAWRYGADPLTFLRVKEHLAACRRLYEQDPRLFNRILDQRVVGNPHRLTVLLKPDREWQARNDDAFHERMEQVRAGLSDERMRDLAAEAEELDRASGEPNPPEALAKLPQLKIGDLPTRPKHIPTSVEELGAGGQLLVNDVFANGVNYISLDFDLGDLPDDLWLHLPRYVDAVSKLGAAGMDYEETARRVAGATGGINCWPNLQTHAAEPGRGLWRLRWSLKLLDDQVEPALNVLNDLVFAVDPRDRARLRDVLVQARAAFRTDLVHQGAGTASRYAARGLTPEGRLAEIVDGLPQLSETERLVSRFDELNEDVMANVERIREFLLTRGRLTVSFTGADAVAETLRRALADWSARMRDDPIRDVPTGFAPYDTPPRDGLAAPIQVAHCAQLIPAPHYSHPDEPLLALAAHLISFEYMLNEVRLKGNAYGAWCRYDAFGQVMALGSYSDPHVARTLHVFEGVRDYVRQADWTQTDVERAIIATAKKGETPIRPGSATGLALSRHLAGLTRELREQRLARILGATVDKVKRAALTALDANWDRSAVCVVSSREKLEEANRQAPARALAIRDILT